MKKTSILLFLLLTGSLSGWAQDHWTEIADTILRYGPFQTYLFETDTRRWLVESEEAEGYDKCYRQFYEALCRMAKTSRQQKPDDPDEECEFGRIYMAWQQGTTDTETARRDLLRILNDDCRLHGDTTLQHIRYVSYLTNFLCEAQRYSEAEQWCLHIDSLMNRKVPVYIWHNCLKLQALMAAQVGQGRLTDAWKTVQTIVNRYFDEAKNLYFFSLPADSFNLNNQQLSETMKAEAARLAPQLLVSMLPPPPVAFTQADIAPWPLSLIADITSTRKLHAFAVFNFLDLLMRIGLPHENIYKVSNKADDMSRQLHDYENIDSIAPPLSAELCRRTAMMSAIEAEHCDTIHYPHDQVENTAMTRWMHCMAQEQLNFGKRSSVALLNFCTEWIKKGYPLSVLPLVEEAAATMRRELNDEKPTQRMLLLQQAARHWLQEKLPLFANLVSTTPDYDKVVADLRALGI